jgi:N-methylhydantoinase A
MMLLGVDTGGTFTDFVLLDAGVLRLHKVMSTPDDPSLAIRQGIADLGLEAAVSAGRVVIVHGSTVATNAALEGKGVRTAYVTNRGFTDVLRIGRQARRDLYTLAPAPSPNPVPDELLLGTGGRIAPDGTVIEPLTPADLTELRRQIRSLQPQAIAINLLFSYVDDTHERAIETALEDLAFVSRSSDVLAEYKEYERGIATWLNAWLGPVVERYLSRLSESVAPSRVVVMQSSGGTIGANQARRRAVNLLLSGPAGGIAAARDLGAKLGRADLLTFDMGGTSTDVSLIGDRPSITREGSIGPYPVAVPMADIHTIASGGGSIAFLDDAGALHVGPQSAGANPGPACYGRGGREPTVTDANVVLGRLPSSLRLAGTLPISVHLARAAVARLAESLGTSIDDAAAGVVAIANEHMARALRLISLERGHDPRTCSLVSFGGAGGLHACALARALEIPRIVIPMHCGVFSAFGMLVADASRQLTKTVNGLFAELSTSDIQSLFDALSARGVSELVDDGAAPQTIEERRFLDLRYRGQSFTLTVDWTTPDAAARAFHEMHHARYGHALDLPIELVNIRSEVSAANPKLTLPELQRNPPAPARSTLRTVQHAVVPLLERGELARDQRIPGPAIVVEKMATTFVDEGWEATVDHWGHLQLAASASPTTG